MEVKKLFYEESLDVTLDPQWASATTKSILDQVTTIFHGRKALDITGFVLSPKQRVEGYSVQGGFHSTGFNLSFSLPPKGIVEFEVNVLKIISNVNRYLEVMDKGETIGLGRLHYMPRRTFVPSDITTL